MRWMDTLWNNGWAKNRNFKPISTKTTVLQFLVSHSKAIQLLSSSSISPSDWTFAGRFFSWGGWFACLCSLTRTLDCDLFSFFASGNPSQGYSLFIDPGKKVLSTCVLVCFYSGEVVKLADTLITLKCCDFSSGHSLNKASNHGHLLWCTLIDLMEVPRGVEMSCWDASRHGRGRLCIDAGMEYNGV